MKTHLPGQRERTLCGHKIDETASGEPRRNPLTLIGRNELVDSATCRACQRADDAQSVRNYRRECREAGVEP